jgi:hypothetical protein
MHLLPRENRSLEDQANASGMVRHVRFYLYVDSLLIRSDWGRLLQVLAALGPGHSSPESATESLPSARSSPASRVYLPGTALRSAVVQRSQTGLTANSQGFRIGGTGGIALLKRCAPALDLRGGEGLGESEAES